MCLKKIIINPVIIGQMNSAYGIKGYINITSFTEKNENIFLYQPWFIFNKKWIKINIEQWKLINNRFIIKIKNINNRNETNLLKNKKIIIDFNQLPQLTNNEYYYNEIIGSKVVTIKNYFFGHVYDILITGANDVLIVKKKIQNTYKISIKLIPFVNTKIIKHIDRINKIITVDWDPNF